MKQKHYVLLTALIGALVVGFWGASKLSAQPARKQQQPQQQQPPPKPKFARIQDEFAELDDTVKTGVIAGVSDKFITTTLETSRQQYLRALSYINKSDTVKAAKSFEQAIGTLNKLTDFPRIEENQDFTDLMQSIIDDYEKNIQSIDNLSETSPFYVLRDKFLQEIDKNSPLYNELTFARDKQARSGVIPLRLPESSSALTSIIGMKGVELQIPMDDPELVQKTTDFLVSERARRYFQRTLERAGRWFPMMRRIAREEGAPEEILYLAMVESALLPKAVSPAAAVGLWQFIKSTGQLYGLETGYWVDERRDPEKATRAAMRHLKDLYNEFGNWHLAMAAYNCGMGGTRRAIARSGYSNPDYWQVRDKLPRETRSYVPLYLAYAKIGMNPEVYGFSNIPLEEEYKYDTVVVYEALDFNVLARCAGINADDLSEFNPELIRNATPGGEYWLKLPPGTKNTFLANFTKLATDDKQTWITHEVTGRESISSIARKYGVSQNVITAANNLTGRKKRLYQGMILRVPKEAGVNDGEELAASPSGSGNDKPKSALEKRDEAREKTTERKEREKEERERKERERADARERDKEEREKVEKSEKTEKVEKAVEKTEKSEKQVKTESSEAATAAIPANSKKLTHGIVQGETLYSIATRYGVRLSDLRNWNNIPYNSDKLSLDDQLVVYVPQNFKDASESKKLNIVTHAVKQGETLAKIADDYEVSVQDIRKASGLGNRDRLYIGQPLKIPATAEKSSGSSSEKSGVEKTVATATKEPVPAPTVPAPQPTTQRPSLNGVTTHQIQKNETLGQIAAKYGVSTSDLAKWNPSAKRGRLYAGTELKILSQGTAKGGAPSAGKSAKFYTVVNGDTPFSIAKKFGITSDQLLKLNKGVRENRLSIGQQLRVTQ